MNLYKVKQNISKKWTLIIILIFIILMYFSNFNFSKNAYPVNANSNTIVIPSGNTIGVKLYVQGVLVVGKSDVVGTDGKIYKPINSTNIKEGDRIIKIDGININNSTELIEYLSTNTNEYVEIEYLRNDKSYIEKIKPMLNKEDGIYRLGIWVKDGAIGVGTLTFYELKSNIFGAIGHGVTDTDTGDLIEIDKGNLLQAKIVDIIKSKRSVPGEIQGIFNDNNILGRVLFNSKKGIYGVSDDIKTIDKYKKGIPVANRNEISVGNATILCNIENEIKEYNVTIEKVYKNSNSENKNMVVKVVDEELLNKTGGIVQGMSGSPIIQKNKFVGAITHVLVNDPTKGFAIFGDSMISEIKKVL